MNVLFFSISEINNTTIIPNDHFHGGERGKGGEGVEGGRGGEERGEKRGEWGEGG